MNPYTKKPLKLALFSHQAPIHNGLAFRALKQTELNEGSSVVKEVSTHALKSENPGLNPNSATY